MGGIISSKKSKYSAPQPPMSPLSHPLERAPNINGEAILTPAQEVQEKKKQARLSISGAFRFDPDDLKTDFMTSKYGIPVNYNSISEKYRFGEELVGVGMFGVITPAYDRAADDADAATSNVIPSRTVKTVSKMTLKTHTEFDRVMSEVILLHTLSHVNLLKMDSFWDNLDSYHIVLEAINGRDMFSFIVDSEVMYESTARSMFVQIVAALEYLHNNGIMHRDIKPDNFLVDSQGVVKISDFSLAAKLGANNSIFSPFGITGTPGYAAPEVLQGELYTFSADLFSAGVMLFILLGGFPPFDISPDTTSYPPHVFTEPFFEHVSEEALALINVLLSPDPKDRGLASGLVESNAWFKMELAGIHLAAGFEKMKDFNAKRKFKVAAKGVTSALLIARATSKVNKSPKNAERKSSMSFNSEQLKELEVLKAKDMNYVRLRSFSAESIKQAALEQENGGGT